MRTREMAFRWKAVVDHKTCPACLILNGHLVPASVRPPLHPSCRCSLEPVPGVVPVEPEGGARNAREAQRRRRVAENATRQRDARRASELDAGARQVRRLRALGRGGLGP